MELQLGLSLAIHTEMVELFRYAQFCYLEKWALILFQTSKIKPGQIERSIFSPWLPTERINLNLQGSIGCSVQEISQQFQQERVPPVDVGLIIIIINVLQQPPE